MEDIKIEDLWAWAIWKDPEEADQRDFVAWDVFGTPSDDELSKVESISLTNMILETVNQWCVPSCTANSLCHLIHIQNAVEEMTTDIWVDHDDQWINNQWKRKVCQWETGDYLERALQTLYKNWVKWKISWRDFVFKIDWYAFQSWTSDGFDKMLRIAAYRMDKLNQPLYVAFRWNNRISLEISQWERKTLIGMQDQTYGHAVWWTGVDFERKYVEFVNSRHHNTVNGVWQKKISSFKISFDLFEKLIKNSMRGWRYFIPFDAKNMTEKPLFVDYAQWSEPEHTEVVKWAKDNGIVKGVPSPQWPRLEPHASTTRLQNILMLYRVAKWILSEVAKIIKKS